MTDSATVGFEALVVGVLGITWICPGEEHAARVGRQSAGNILPLHLVRVFNRIANCGAKQAAVDDAVPRRIGQRDRELTIAAGRPVKGGIFDQQVDSLVLDGHVFGTLHQGFGNALDHRAGKDALLGPVWHPRVDFHEAV